ncbi:MAG: GerAB/ArcD/ProY family transporter [Tumebacillaceae bacterium]
MGYKGTISSRQYMLMAALFVVGSSILFAPSVLAMEAKQDGWLCALVGLVGGLLVVLLYNDLARRHPDHTVIEYSKRVVGTWAGGVISLLLILHFCLLSALVLRDMGDFITSQLLTTSPIESILILYLPVIVFGTRLGLETMARTTELLFPLFLLFFVVLVVSVAPQIKTENIQPVFEHGFAPILHSGMTFWGFPFLELVCFLMIAPAVKDRAQASKALLWGTLIGGVILLLFTLICLLVLGPWATTHNNNPSYLLAKKINIAEFFTRIEALMALMWLISLSVKLVLNFYAATFGLAQLLRLQDYRMLTIPLAMLILIVSIISIPNSVYFFRFTQRFYLPYVLPFGLGIPFLLWVASIFSKKQGDGQEQEGSHA